MGIVKIIAILMIVFVLAFGGALFVYTSRLEEEIAKEIAVRDKRRGMRRDIDDEI